MKLTTVFEQEEEILEEGLKFGNKEKKLVDLEAKNIIVGVEYEYHVDEDAGDFEPEEEDRFENESWRDAVYDRASELIQEDMDEKEKEFKEGYADNDMEEYNVESGTASLNSIKNIFDNNFGGFSKINDIQDEFETIISDWEEGEVLSSDDQKIVSEYISTIKFHRTNIFNINQEMQSLEEDEQLDRWVHIIGDRDLSENLEDAKNAMDAFDTWADEVHEIDPNDIEKIKDAYDVDWQEYSSDIDDWLTDAARLSGNDNEWDRQIHAEFEEYAEDLWDESKEHVLGYDPDNIHESEFWEQAEEEVDYDDYREGGSSGSIVGWVDEQLRTDDGGWGIDYNDIREVTTDPSVDHGVETITKPLKFHDALDTMKSMFDHISAIGSTSHKTGMHVNLSIKGLRFRRDNFNMTKLILLLNPRMLKEFFGLRSYTADQFDGIDAEFIFNIAGQRNTNQMIQYFEDKALKKIKHQEVNFLNFQEADAVNVGADRIEFRFFGGTDYEERYNAIEWNLYRVAYLTMASYSENFGQKEYLKEMVKILDEKSAEYYAGATYRELVDWRKRNPTANKVDMEIDMKGGTRKGVAMQRRISGRGR